jgi:tRNA1(Val) A37 N6-methylase TrmN6
MRGDIADYCSVAARCLAPGGFFACVFPMAQEQEGRLKDAAARAELTIVRRRPVVLREGERPLIGLFGLMRAGDLPDWMRAQSWSEAPLVIRRADGSVHPEYSAVKVSFGFPP